MAARQNLSGAAFAGPATGPTPAFGDSGANFATTAFVANATRGVTTISTSGGTTTLTQAQASAPVLVVTGTLTAAAVIVVPNTGLFTVANRTTGAFALTVKTAAGTGANVTQGTTDYFVADGANVVMGDSDLAGAVITAGTVDSTPVGSKQPSTGAFTSLSASTSFTLGAGTVPAGTAGNVFPSATLNAPAGWFRVFTYQTAGVKRWDLGTSGDAETGGNAGSIFFLNAFDDAGNFLNNLFNAYRNTGVFSINNVQILAGTIAGAAISNSTASTPAAGDSSGALATTAFVNGAVDGLATFSTTGATTTLTQAQYSAAALIVTGALTSNAVLVVPNSGISTFINRTSGAFSLTVKTAAGTGTAVAQGYARTLIADGTNVVPSNNDLAAPGPIGQSTPAAASFTALTLGSNAAAGTSTFNGQAGAARVTTFYTAGSKRWDVGVNGGAEAGSNLGSDFYWARYNDSGVVIDNPLTINRGSGVVAATSLATTAYLYASGATGLTAAGTTQATGYAINRSISVFTTVAAGAGATLPNVAPQSLSSTVMAEFTVVNAGANALLLYPASGLAINALAANAALSVAAGATIRGFQASTTAYRFG